MNLDDHWLKERYKDKSVESLRIDLLFATTHMEAIEITSEIERREKEANEHHKPML
jgi:hypothetical protein